MRCLVFGDVHGNLPALEKMLHEEMHHFDILISHGDVVNYGPWSNECVDLLKNLNCICLKGNHENYFLNNFYPGKNIVVKTFFEFCVTSFNKKEIIAQYNDYFDIPGYRIIHSLDGHYFFPDTDFTQLSFDRNYIFGHSHYQFFAEANSHKLYNTGSVGQNRKFINIINYLMVDTENGSVELKFLKYDVELLINKMATVDYPEICINYYKQKKQA